MLVSGLHQRSPDSHLILVGDVPMLAKHYARAEEAVDGYLDWDALTPDNVIPLIEVVARGQGKVLVVSRAAMWHVTGVVRDDETKPIDGLAPALSDLTDRQLNG